jgi:hypothetical protein
LIYFRGILLEQEEEFVNTSEAYLIGTLTLETLQTISNSESPNCSVVLINRVEEEVQFQPSSDQWKASVLKEEISPIPQLQ